jgi:hypothetical protein
MTIITIASFSDRLLVQNWILSLKRVGFKKFAVICYETQLLNYLNELGHASNAVLVPRHTSGFFLLIKQTTITQKQALSTI